ncbi:hypothetical protein D210916BOD24_11150 [Alteromonas sp. D210916BOD_24]|uniref:hypothetical protein n=1 Tax=Alteromonas sp. D210916BOD_24 TaxID=3157618 RepID=UPI00399C9B42
MTHSKKTKQQNEPQNPLLNNGEQLIQEAMSIYNLESFSPVQMAFPNVISNQQENTQGDFALNIQELFAQQSQLFNPPPPPTNIYERGSLGAEEDSQELQAIRAMFDAT